MTWDKYVLNLSYQVTITIHYEKTTQLPMLHAYNSIYSTTESLDMTRCVTSEKKQNLTHLEKLLLQWCFKLGHTGFSIVQWIGSQVWLGNMGYKIGNHNVKIIKYAAFHYGKQ